jgi:hypothetical protein
MEYKAEDFISFIENNRLDKVSPNGLELIAKRFRELECEVNKLSLGDVSGSIELKVGMEVLIKNNKDDFFNAAGKIKKIKKELSNYDKKRAFELEGEHGIWLIEDFEYCISNPNFEMI